MPIHLKVFGPGVSTYSLGTMPDEAERPRFREHLHEIRESLGGIGKDVAIDVANSPHLAKEGAKNAMARAAGVKRTPVREWTEPSPETQK
jgi:hypothetical protein